MAAELRHPCRKRLASSFHAASRCIIVWLANVFASIRGGVGHTTRCANERRPLALKITRTIVRDIMRCQDRDIVFGTLADALLTGVKENRAELLRELKILESRDPKTLEPELRDMGLPKYVSASDFVVTLRVLASLENGT